MELFADEATREIRGMLIPHGELSRPNISGTEPVMFSAETAIEMPPLPLIGLNIEHDRFAVFAAAKSIETTAAGRVAVFSVPAGPDGDAALAAVKSKRLTMLSPEFATILRRGAQAVRAKLTGAGLVGAGAFASAQLFALAVEPEPAPEPTPDPSPAPAEPAPQTAEPVAPAVEEPVNPTIPPTLPSADPAPAAPTQTQGALFAAQRDGLRAALGRIAGAVGSGPEDFRIAQEWFQRQGNMFAALSAGDMFALSDVKWDGTGGVGSQMVQPQWLGENRGPEYISRFAPLFNHGDLTSLALGGFKWGTKPAGGTWAGNKAAISSNTPTIVPETETATRWAGGHDIAREHLDFKTPGFFESYEYWMLRSYREYVDKTIVLGELLAGATDLEADNPAGLDIGPAMSAIIDGAAAVIDAGYTPTFATLDTAYWKTIAKTTRNDILGYLNAQISLRVGEDSQLDTFRIVPAPVGTVTAQHVVVGAQDAATLYELPGVPIRAEAVNIANGGLDYGYFGYAGLKIENAAALVDVAPYTP